MDAKELTKKYWALENEVAELKRSRVLEGRGTEAPNADGRHEDRLADAGKE